MTREEAIKILTPFREAMIDQHGCPISDAVYALDVAIKSLEAWDEVRKSLDQLDHIYMNVSGQMIRIYPQWNVDRIIEEHLREVEG